MVFEADDIRLIAVEEERGLTAIVWKVKVLLEKFSNFIILSQGFESPGKHF